MMHYPVYHEQHNKLFTDRFMTMSDQIRKLVSLKHIPDKSKLIYWGFFCLLITGTASRGAEEGEGGDGRNQNVFQCFTFKISNIYITTLQQHIRCS